MVSGSRAAPGYYIDSKDGMSDLYACAACVEKNGLSTANPVDPEVFAWAPLGCGIHAYGADPEDYV